MSGGPSVPDEVLSPLPAPGAHPPPTGGQPPVDGSVPVAGSVPPGPGVGEGSRGRVSPWNAANAVTLLRLVLVPVFGWLLLHEGGETSGWRTAAAVVFAVAVVTDRVDGDLARRRGLVTDLGKIADPLADKALVGTALVGLSVLDELAWWVTVIVLVFGVLRKELALIMLAALLGTTEFGLVLSAQQMYVFALIVLLYVPCISTIAVFRRVADFVRQAVWSQGDIDRGIIGVAKRDEKPLRPSEATGVALQRHMIGESFERRCRRRRQLLEATPDNVRQALLQALEAGLPQAAICVMTNRSRLEQARQTLGSLTIEDVLK